MASLMFGMAHSSVLRTSALSRGYVSVGGCFRGCSLRSGTGMVSVRKRLHGYLPPPQGTAVFKRQLGAGARAQGGKNEASLGSAPLVLFEKNSKMRLLAAAGFVVSQGVYWSWYMYDTVFFPTAGRQGTSRGSVVNDSLFVMFYTHPAWAIVGAGMTVLSAILYKMGTSHYISRITFSPWAHEMAFYAHTLGGNVGKARVYPLSVVRFIEPLKTASYVMCQVPDQSTYFIINRAGKFRPSGEDAPSFEPPTGLGASERNRLSDTHDKQVEQRVFQQLGVPWAGGSWDVGSDTPNAAEPPTVEELRRRRREAQRYG